MEPQFHNSNEERTFANLFAGIVSDTQQLVRQELALAKSEIKTDWVRGKNALSLYAGAAVGGFFAMGLFLMALVSGLIAVGFPAWAAYGLMAVLVSVVGIACYLLGKRWAQDVQILPKAALHSVQENVQWLKKPHLDS